MGAVASKSTKGRPASMAQCRRVLGALPFLENLQEGDLAELAGLLRVRDFVAGATIFYEDDDPDAVYFIERGAVEVFKSDGEGRKLPLAVLRDAGVVGEMGLLLNEPRTASARTLCSVRTLVMNNESVNAALEANSLAAYRLVLAFARVLSQRLAIVDHKLFELCDKLHDHTPLRETNEYSSEVAHAR